MQFISVIFTSVRGMCTLPQPLAETGLYVWEYPWCFCLCCWQSTEVDVTVRHYQCSLHACPGNKTLKRCTGRIISLTMLPWHLGNIYLISADLHSMSSAIKINKSLLKWMGPCFGNRRSLLFGWSVPSLSILTEWQYNLIH